MLSRIKSQVGDTLVEVTIAAGLLSFALVAGLLLAVLASRYVQAAKFRTTAINLAQEQSEALHNLRDVQGYSALAPGGSNPLPTDGNTGAPTHFYMSQTATGWINNNNKNLSSGIYTAFITSYFTQVENPNDEMRYTVTVRWRGPFGSENTKDSSYITDLTGFAPIDCPNGDLLNCFPTVTHTCTTGCTATNPLLLAASETESTEGANSDHAPSKQQNIFDLAQNFSLIVNILGSYDSSDKVDPGSSSWDYIKSMHNYAKVAPAGFNNGNLTILVNQNGSHYTPCNDPAHQYPQMAHDQAGNDLSSGGFAFQVVMDVSQASYQAFRATTSASNVTANPDPSQQWDGAWYDVLGREPLTSAFNQNHLQPVPPAAFCTPVNSLDAGGNFPWDAGAGAPLSMQKWFQGGSSLISQTLTDLPAGKKLVGYNGTEPVEMYPAGTMSLLQNAPNAFVGMDENWMMGKKDSLIYPPVDGVPIVNPNDTNPTGWLDYVQELVDAGDAGHPIQIYTKEVANCNDTWDPTKIGKTCLQVHDFVLGSFLLGIGSQTSTVPQYFEFRTSWTPHQYCLDQTGAPGPCSNTVLEGYTKIGNPYPESSCSSTQTVSGSSKTVPYQHYTDPKGVTIYYRIYPYGVVFVNPTTSTADISNLGFTNSQSSPADPFNNGDLFDYYKGTASPPPNSLAPNSASILRSNTPLPGVCTLQLQTLALNNTNSPFAGLVASARGLARFGGIGLALIEKAMSKLGFARWVGSAQPQLTVSGLPAPPPLVSWLWRRL